MSVNTNQLPTSEMAQKSWEEGEIGGKGREKGAKQKETFGEEGEIGSKSREEGEIGSESREKGDLPPVPPYFTSLKPSFQVNFTFRVVNTKFVNLDFVVIYIDY